MHVLGSKILGNDIHLAVPKGVKLEASKHLDTSVNFVHESDLLLGFYSKNQNEAGVTLCLHDNMEKLKVRTQHLEKSELIAKDTLTIIAKDGTFEQLSSQLAAKIIQVDARDWLAKTYSADN